MVIVGWDVADYALLLARYSTLLLGKISWGDPSLALRFLLLVILAYLVFLLIKVFLSSSGKGRLRQPQERLDKGEEMVLDPQCQSYLPKSEAIFSHGHYFCSEQCARLFVTTR